MIGKLFRHIDECVFWEKRDAAKAAIGQAGFAIHHADDILGQHAVGLAEGDKHAGHAGFIWDRAAFEFCAGPRALGFESTLIALEWSGVADLATACGFFRLAVLFDR